MVHSVQIGKSEISDNTNAMPYALCPMRFSGLWNRDVFTNQLMSL